MLICKDCYDWWTKESPSTDFEEAHDKWREKVLKGDNARCDLCQKIHSIWKQDVSVL